MNNLNEIWKVHVYVLNIVCMVGTRIFIYFWETLTKLWRHLFPMKFL